MDSTACRFGWVRWVVAGLLVAAGAVACGDTATGGGRGSIAPDPPASAPLDNAAPVPDAPAPPATPN